MHPRCENESQAVATDCDMPVVETSMYPRQQHSRLAVRYRTAFLQHHHGSPTETLSSTSGFQELRAIASLRKEGCSRGG